MSCHRGSRPPPFLWGKPEEEHQVLELGRKFCKHSSKCHMVIPELKPHFGDLHGWRGPPPLDLELGSVLEHFKKMVGLWLGAGLGVSPNPSSALLPSFSAILLQVSMNLTGPGLLSPSKPASLYYAALMGCELPSELSSFSSVAQCHLAHSFPLWCHSSTKVMPTAMEELEGMLKSTDIVLKSAVINHMLCIGCDLQCVS